MAKYRKKPVVIEAVQLKDESIIEIINWTTDYINIEIDTDENDNIIGMIIPTLEGAMKASMNDYIIKGVNNEFYPIKSEIFFKTYEKVE